MCVISFGIISAGRFSVKLLYLIQQFSELDFLNDINFDTRMFTRLDRMVVVPVESPQSKVLKNAAVRLVRLGAFSEARDVLKILM